MATVFHSLVTVEEALELVDKSLGDLKPLGTEKIPVTRALGRTLAENVLAHTSAPPFDRSTVDGYAVKASDTYTASEETPVILEVVGKAVVGVPFEGDVVEGKCVEIATGAVVPRGANAVVMVEFTKKLADGKILVYRPVSPNENIAQTGSDVSAGDTVLRKGTVITPREIAVLTSVGLKEVVVYRKVRAAVFSTGDEIIESGAALPIGKIYDVNGPTLTAMMQELGAEVDFMGILPDDYGLMVAKIGEALRSGYDIVVTSGSTSAGFGDIVYRIFRELSGGKVLVHGLRVKPGKPTALAVAGGKLLVGLPGFPLSAMMVFQKLVKPIVETLSGINPKTTRTVKARLALRVEAGKGKLEMIPVQIINTEKEVVAYPLLGQSGSTHILSIADGILEAPENREFFDEGEEVEIGLLSERIRPPELVVIGSHCPGVDLLLDEMNIADVKVVNVGSVAGWHAVKSGEADIAGTHLLDEKTGVYNAYMLERLGLKGKAVLVRGYGRRIGFVTQKGNPKGLQTFEDLLRGDVMMVNRVKGSGIRTFIDIKLAEIGVKDPVKHIRGYDYEVRTHTGVAAAVAQGRADVGITLEAVARQQDLEFIPLAEELYDFAVPKQRLTKKTVEKFIQTLSNKTFQEKLKQTLPGYRPLTETGTVVEG
ncbi:MAG: molybdopterin biosynthesis protein [Candidatus Caldarchaeum sp.]|nr:molybdopterin biosynthesis protein [Candidatus Caldarchaeum sp.]MDW8434811.1 molybdopterin biosynthesis protein [Candidatus Caldarchaeum sp.]